MTQVIIRSVSYDSKTGWWRTKIGFRNQTVIRTDCNNVELSKLLNITHNPSLKFPLIGGQIICNSNQVGDMYIQGQQGLHIPNDGKTTNNSVNIDEIGKMHLFRQLNNGEIKCEVVSGGYITIRLSCSYEIKFTGINPESFELIFQVVNPSSSQSQENVISPLQLIATASVTGLCTIIIFKLAGII
jgi:hypothetical protein